MPFQKPDRRAAPAGTRPLFDHIFHVGLDQRNLLLSGTHQPGKEVLRVGKRCRQANKMRQTIGALHPAPQQKRSLRAGGSAVGVDLIEQNQRRPIALADAKQVVARWSSSGGSTFPLW